MNAADDIKPVGVYLRGGGCSTTSAAPSSAWLLLLGLVGLRRRSRR